MTKNSNILNELKELESSLAGMPVSNPYLVPEGYFSDLAERVLMHIKSMQLHEEEITLPASFGNLSKEMPYSVPQGYFQNLPGSMLQLIQKVSVSESAAEELAGLSPLLSGLKKEMPYSVPQGYFENLAMRETKPAAKVISLVHRRWFRMAAAAVITGFIVLAGFLVFHNNSTTGEPGSKALAKFTKDVKKMDDSQQDDLMDFIDAGLMGDESAQTNVTNQNEIKELLKDVSDQELLDLKQQTEDLESVLMLN